MVLDVALAAAVQAAVSGLVEERESADATSVAAAAVAAGIHAVAYVVQVIECDVLVVGHVQEV